MALLEIQDTIRDFQVALTLARVTPGGVDSRGYGTQTTSTSSIFGVLQPAQPEALRHLPAGQETLEHWTIWSLSEIRVRDLIIAAGPTVSLFDTITDVDAVNDRITITDHGWQTGDHVTYSNEGLTDTIGLTSGDSYWVNVFDGDNVTIHSTRAAAQAGTGAIDLSDGSTGENHSLTRNDSYSVETAKYWAETPHWEALAVRHNPTTR